MIVPLDPGLVTSTVTPGLGGVGVGLGFPACAVSTIENNANNTPLKIATEIFIRIDRSLKSLFLAVPMILAWYAVSYIIATFVPSGEEKSSMYL